MILADLATRATLLLILAAAIPFAAALLREQTHHIRQSIQKENRHDPHP